MNVYYKQISYAMFYQCKTREFHLALFVKLHFFVHFKKLFNYCLLFNIKLQIYDVQFKEIASMKERRQGSMCTWVHPLSTFVHLNKLLKAAQKVPVWFPVWFQIFQGLSKLLSSDSNLNSLGGTCSCSSLHLSLWPWIYSQEHSLGNRK